MTVRSALSGSSADLKNAGIETASIDASLLLAHVLGINRTALAANGTEELSEESFISFRTLINRRLNGECIAYILGKKEFRCMDFFVNPSVLVPRPDTETLVEAAIKQLAISNKLPADSGSDVANNSIRVMDLCTGSGAIAISLKKEMPHLEIWATDISVKALETAKGNASHLLPDVSIHFCLGDLYDALSPHFQLPAPLFNLIVSNPPYVPANKIRTLPAEVQNEPRLALDGGPSGLEIIKRIIKDAPNVLKRDGCILLEADPRQMRKIAIILEERGFKDIKLNKDLSGQERIIGGKYEK
jgi:release factor glutamine methyltransferase